MRSHFRFIYSFAASLVLSMIICTHAFSYTSIGPLRVSSPPISPTLTSISPQNSNVGDTVKITGTGFAALNIIDNKVSFVNSWYLASGAYEYDTIHAEIFAVTDTTIMAIVPSGATQGNISVSVHDEYATSSNDVSYNVIPTLESFLPDSGYIGDTIVITGTGFNAWHPSTNYVMFNGVLTSCISASPTSIKVPVPFGTTTGPIMVFTNTPRVTSTLNFHVLPVIIPPVPTSGRIDEEINISGTGFDPALAAEYKLSFNGMPAVITVIGLNVIRARVPKYATSGPMRLIFKNVEVKGSGTDFTVITEQPRVYNFTPEKGVIGTPVVIHGWEFDQGPGLSVRFGGRIAEIDSSTDNNIYTKVPPGAQTGAITVTAGGQTSDANTYFRVIETIFGMAPSTAKVGDTIVVTGNGYTSVFLEYYTVIIPQRSLTVPYVSIHPISVTDTQLKFIVPPSASSSFNPRIISEYNIGINIQLPLLNIIPVITRIEPDTVIAGRKTEITIHGRSVMPFIQTVVIFSDTIVQRIIYNNTDASLSATVPSTVASGTIPVSIRVDDLLSAPFDLVVLPDTFPYTPLPPELLYASDVTTTSFKCNWRSCYRALGYILDVSSDNFKTYLPGLEALVTTDTSKVILGLEAGTSYSFRLRPYSNTDTTALNTPGTYGGVVTIPLPPVAISATNVSTSGFICRWHSVKGALLYSIDVSDDLFVSYISADIPDTVAMLSITADKIPPTLQYRARAKNDWGASEYSNVITVAIITGEGDEPGIEIVTLYPNPANTEFFISGLDEEAVRETIVIDVTGKATPVTLNYKGNNVFACDIHALTNGLYILQMVVHKKVIQLKFIKQ